MLRIGLTGGIGAGKSSVARRLAELGAVVVDADLVAREVVRPGTPGLAAIAERFGDGVITADGALDRPALGSIVFADDGARRALEEITHPLIAERTAALIAQVPTDGILVHDVPLLVEGGMGGRYHLVLVVDTAEEERVRRLVRDRGMTEEQARSRIAAQASDEQRRAAADVLLCNDGRPEDLQEAVEQLWRERLAPFAANLAAGRRRERDAVVTLSPPDPTWPAQARRQLERIALVVGDRARSLEHIGSTSVPGLVAKDVVDLQLGVDSLTELDQPGIVEALTAAGYPRVEGFVADTPRPGGGAPQRWAKRFHGSSDPGMAVHLHIREVASPGWRWSLLFRDWLRADGQARAQYADLKTQVAARDLPMEAYAEAKEPWFDQVHATAERWADATGWQPPELR